MNESRFALRSRLPLLCALLALALLLLSGPRSEAQQPPPDSGPATQVSAPAEDEGAARFRDDNPGQRERWFYEQRAAPLGFIPFGIRQRAVAAREAMRQRERQLRIGTFAPDAASAQAAPSGENPFPQAIPANPNAWTPIGPQPTNTNSATIKQVSGRVSAAAVDPTDPNIVYIGGAQGGVWKTTDGGATWTPLTDSEASLAIGAIAIENSAASCGASGPCQTIYVGTGEQTNAIDSYYGAGILKSTNGGASWTQLGQATFLGPGGEPFSPVFSPGAGARISSLAIRPGTSGPTAQILAGVLIFQRIDTGTSSGIYRSVDGGANWTQVVSGAAGSEVLFDPTIDTGGTGLGNIAYAALGTVRGDPDNGIYKSTNGGQSWVKLAGNLPTVDLGRIEIALAPSTPNILYASIANSSGMSDDLLGVWKTTNGGANWMQLAPANPLLSGSTSTCSAQCFYDHVIRVHPNNPDVVYLGGAATGFNVGMGNYFIRSVDGGTNWTGIASDGTDRLHVDIHTIAFSMNGANASRLFIGTDGGVWSTIVSTSGMGGVGGGAIDWENHNGVAAGSAMSLSLSQFYPGHSIHPSNIDVTLGGTQDNGMQRFTGTLGWQDVSVCGDGGFTAIDPDTPTRAYAACQRIDVNRSTSGGTASSFVPITGNLPASSAERSAFIPPMVLDSNANFAPFSARPLYFATCRVWRNTAPATGATWTAISQDLTTENGGASCPPGPPANPNIEEVRALAISPNDSRMVYAGTSDSRVWRTLNANVASPTWTNITGAGMLPSRMVTSIAVDPHDASGNTAYVGFSGFTVAPDTRGHIFATLNGGAAWTDISANLPNTPVNDIVIDPNFTGTIYIGTDIGAFITTDNGASWQTLQSGLPNVAVLGLKLHNPSRTLRAGTHGRGMWDILLPAGTPAPSFTLSANPTTVTVPRGQSGSSTITVTPQNGAFTSAITFSCTGLPAQSTCIFNPASVTPGAATATTQVTLTTTAPGMIPSSPQAQRWTPPPIFVLSFTLLALLLFAAGLTLRLSERRAPPRPAARRARHFAAPHAPAFVCYLAAVLVLAALTVACGGGGSGGAPAPPPNPGTPIGTSTVTVRGTAGATQRTVNVTFTVQ